MKRGDRVVVSGGLCDGLQGTIVLPMGSAALVRFPQPVRRRNGMLSEEIWLGTRQLTLVGNTTEASATEP